MGSLYGNINHLGEELPRAISLFLTGSATSRSYTPCPQEFSIGIRTYVGMNALNNDFIIRKSAQLILSQWLQLR